MNSKFRPYPPESSAGRGLRIGSGHTAARGFLRVLGVLFVLVGGIFALVGFVDFFGAFSGRGMPTKFWCLFVGLPLLSFGTMMLKAGFLGAASRYMANETVPVARDAAVEVADGLRPVVRDFAREVRAEAAPDPAGRLRKLEELKAQGLITEPEYREQRTRILDAI